jgi:hypothetical protein
VYAPLESGVRVLRVCVHRRLKHALYVGEVEGTFLPPHSPLPLIYGGCGNRLPQIEVLLPDPIVRFECLVESDGICFIPKCDAFYVPPLSGLSSDASTHPSIHLE